ncbi:XK-related protein 8.3 isoform X3 [Anarrhichthys ocellatus]|uniref:XK-related protein 8.3 isoform X3 n=1 Tax=Anarrhichthys ocellatus TaxID=433405 RepID=UPI0012EDDF62|nr:XK-related protein 8 isoform X3 [Anarrhichthys ocellatus]
MCCSWVSFAGRPTTVHISAIRQGFRVWWRKEEGSEYAVYLTHDLSMLRLIETFCESAPQLTLMIYVMLHMNKARTVQCEFTSTPREKQTSSARDSVCYQRIKDSDPHLACKSTFICVVASRETSRMCVHFLPGCYVDCVTSFLFLAVVSIAASTTSIAWMVVDYHRSLRSFLPDKAKQGWCSSLIYFLWNLLLIAPRVAALALFASALSGYMAAHFLMLWSVFALWAWQQGTNFMDSVGGEWLYRATVGLIWYFSWFNVAEGQTRSRSVIYHSFITTDGVILLTTWWCYRDPVQTESYALALLIALPLIYLLGLLFKALYYCCFHPKLWRPPVRDPGLPVDQPDADVSFRVFSIQDGDLSSQLLNRRMAGHAARFYSKKGFIRNSDTTNGAESSRL